MPNINIRERDITSPGVAVSGQDVVFVPGFVNALYTESSEYVDAYTPVLCDSVAQFETWFGAIPASFKTAQTYSEQRFATDAIPTNKKMFAVGDMDPGYIYAKEMLNAGLSVVYVRCNETADEITLAHMYDVLSGATEYDVWTDIKDMGEFIEIKYLTSGGYPTFEYHAAPHKSYSTTGAVNVKSFDATKYPDTVTNSWLFTYWKNVIVIDITEEFPPAESANPNKIYIRGDVAKKVEDGVWVTLPELPEWTLDEELGEQNVPVSMAELRTTYGIDADSQLMGNTINVSVTVYVGSTIAEKMIDVAATRGDCVALIDHTNNPNRTLNPAKKQSVYWSVSNTDSTYRITTDGSFATMFTPWCGVTFASDFVNAQNKYDYQPVAMPASFCYLMSLAKSIRSNGNWLAIAGASRGVVNITMPYLAGNLRLSNTVADLYQPETGIAINPITNVKPYGYIIWGNRTLASNPDGLTASSFLNTRNMISDIKKRAYKEAKRCMFEQNSDVLWANYKARVTPLLESLVGGGGLSGYKLIKETPEKKAQLKCTIRLYPIYAVESFDITVELADDEVTVS